jgi:hypothetical protein
MDINRDMSWSESPNMFNEFVTPGKFARGATVSVFGSADHGERVRPFLPLAVRYLRLKERGQ